MAFMMGRGGSRQKPEQKQKDVSLNDVLPTTASKVDLILLVVLCTDNMRDKLTAAFEEQRKSPTTPAADVNDLLLLDDEPKENRQRVQSPRSDLQQIQRMQLSSHETQAFKAAAVKHFNDWRTSVLRRMGEALSVRPDLVKQAKQKFTSSRDAEARRKKYQEYVDWAEGIDAVPSVSDDAETDGLLPTVDTPLTKYEEQQRALILNSCLFILLSLESYTAHSRALMQYLCRCLRLPTDVLVSSESTLALTLIKSASSAEINADDARERRAAEGAFDRKWKIGLATLGGAALVGITGGLAAPLLLGVAGSIMGGVGLGGLASLLGATIANPGTVAILFGVLGGKYGKTSMTAYTKEIEDFQFVPIRGRNLEQPSRSPDGAAHKLRVLIGVSGWLLDERDIAGPWQVLSKDSCESFALQYETRSLIKLGTTLDDVFRQSAYSLAQAGALSAIAPIISAALLPVSLLKVGMVLDNPFSIALQASDKAGKVLATALIDRAQGHRPVTLVGYSLGARVIYSCLLELADKRAFGLVEHAVLAGGPVPCDDLAWRKLRTVVVGRLINVYTEGDMILGFCYRARNAQLSIAGLQAISNIAGVESKDVSGFVKGHNQYRLAVGQILQEIQFDDIDREASDHQREELHAEDEREREVHRRAQNAGQLQGQEDDSGRIIMADNVETEEQRLAKLEKSSQRKGNKVQPEATVDALASSARQLNLSDKQETKTAHLHATDNAPHPAEDTSDESEEDEPIRMLDLPPEPEQG